eukprot:GHVN01051310.1.p1 GENE.GHVN01051310.1~~GHVN01051310.1.p1  ORF type:complete len:1162 (-),score=225.26 GHVN01051310.1:389-3874(-)
MSFGDMSKSPRKIGFHEEEKSEKFGSLRDSFIIGGSSPVSFGYCDSDDGTPFVSLPRINGLRKTVPNINVGTPSPLQASRAPFVPTTGLNTPTHHRLTARPIAKQHVTTTSSVNSNNQTNIWTYEDDSPPLTHKSFKRQANRVICEEPDATPQELIDEEGPTLEVRSAMPTGHVLPRELVGLAPQIRLPAQPSFQKNGSSPSPPESHSRKERQDRQGRHLKTNGLNQGSSSLPEAEDSDDGDRASPSPLSETVELQLREKNERIREMTMQLRSLLKKNCDLSETLHLRDLKCEELERQCREAQLTPDEQREKEDRVREITLELRSLVKKNCDLEEELRNRELQSDELKRGMHHTGEEQRLNCDNLSKELNKVQDELGRKCERLEKDLKEAQSLIDVKTLRCSVLERNLVEMETRAGEDKESKEHVQEVTAQLRKTMQNTNALEEQLREREMRCEELVAQCQQAQLTADEQRLNCNRLSKELDELGVKCQQLDNELQEAYKDSREARSAADQERLRCVELAEQFSLFKDAQEVKSADLEKQIHKVEQLEAELHKVQLEQSLKCGQLEKELAKVQDEQGVKCDRLIKERDRLEIDLNNAYLKGEEQRQICERLKENVDIAQSAADEQRLRCDQLSKELIKFQKEMRLKNEQLEKDLDKAQTIANEERSKSNQLARALLDTQQTADEQRRKFVESDKEKDSNLKEAHSTMADLKVKCDHQERALSEAHKVAEGERLGCDRLVKNLQDAQSASDGYRLKCERLANDLNMAQSAADELKLKCSEFEKHLSERPYHSQSQSSSHREERCPIAELKCYQEIERRWSDVQNQSAVGTATLNRDEIENRWQLGNRRYGRPTTHDEDETRRETTVNSISPRGNPHNNSQVSLPPALASFRKLRRDSGSSCNTESSSLSQPGLIKLVDWRRQSVRYRFLRGNRVDIDEPVAPCREVTMTDPPHSRFRGESESEKGLRSGRNFSQNPKPGYYKTSSSRLSVQSTESDQIERLPPPHSRCHLSQLSHTTSTRQSSARWSSSATNDFQCREASLVNSDATRTRSLGRSDSVPAPFPRRGGRSDLKAASGWTGREKQEPHPSPSANLAGSGSVHDRLMGIEEKLARITQFDVGDRVASGCHSDPPRLSDRTSSSYDRTRSPETIDHGSLLDRRMRL